jgi:molybdopterin synthase catalytic subunit
MKQKDKILIKVKIQNDDFDVSKEMKKLQTNETGAIVNFVGIVRGKDEKTNEDIFSMTLEHYPGMTELEIESIVTNSTTRWEISAVTVIHRIGKLFSSDQIVFVGVASKHRQNAFDACNYIMDWLKTKAPFWKIEEGSKEKKWVELNSSDSKATRKWEQK